MKTFFNILQTLIGIENKTYPDDPFVLSENYVIDNIYFSEKGHIKYLINTIFFNERKIINVNINQFSKNAIAKFTSLNSILQNSFYQKEHTDLIFDFFQKAQKHYYAFIRLAHIYRLKKNTYVVTNDLMMNTLEPNNKLTFILVENKSNFLFNINEIINIIETAIGHSPDFFCQPLSPLNPYNNQPLSNATLYNIYFQMKKIGRVISLLFHCFFLENFNKNNFIRQYEPNIREYSINKYIFNSPHTVLYSSVIYMLRFNEFTKQLTIDKDFPKDLLVNIFRPFLFHHYIANYYIKDSDKMNYSKQLLNIKLKKFYKFNPIFGRKTIKLIKKNNKVIKQEYILNTKHISFYDIPFYNDNIIIERQDQSINRLNRLIHFFQNTELLFNRNNYTIDLTENISNDSDDSDDDDSNHDDSNDDDSNHNDSNHDDSNNNNSNDDDINYDNGNDNDNNEVDLFENINDEYQDENDSIS